MLMIRREGAGDAAFFPILWLSLGQAIAVVYCYERNLPGIRFPSKVCLRDRFSSPLSACFWTLTSCSFAQHEKWQSALTLIIKMKELPGDTTERASGYTERKHLLTLFKAMRTAMKRPASLFSTRKHFLCQWEILWNIIYSPLRKKSLFFLIHFPFQIAQWTVAKGEGMRAEFYAVEKEEATACEDDCRVFVIAPHHVPHSVWKASAQKEANEEEKQENLFLRSCNDNISFAIRIGAQFEHGSAAAGKCEEGNDP